MEHLSNIELYYTSPEFVECENLTLHKEEFHHSVNVMRNSVGALIHVTDGKGTIYKTKITAINKNNLSAIILEKLKYENRSANIWICIPQLKNPDRVKFAFEKCVELGITNFVLFSSKHTISKKINSEKFRKTTIAAMKQSLRAFLPKIISSSFEEIIKLQGSKVLFDQKSKTAFDGCIDINKSTYFLFGPEGGFDENEVNSIKPDEPFNLSVNRLRSETAIIKCASLLKFN